MKIPATAPPEIQQAFREVWIALDRWNGAQNIDLSGRRIINANAGLDPMDYVTRDDVETLIDRARVDTDDTSVGLTGLVPGAVLFARSATTIGQDATNFYWNDVLNCLGIGTRLPTSPLHLLVSGASGVRVDSYGSTALLKGYGSAGTTVAPTATASGQAFAGLWAYGYTGAAWASAPSGRLEFTAQETFGTTAQGTKLDIYLTAATTASCVKMARFDGSGVFYVGRYAGTNTKMSVGITSDQYASDDEALALQASAEVAHGITDNWNTATWFAVSRVATEGGAAIQGIDGTNVVAIQCKAASGAEDATRSASGVAPFVVDAFLKNGTALTNLAADKNLAAFRNAGSAKAIIDTDGDIHLDGSSNNTVWDAYDDIELLTAYRALTGAVDMRARFGATMAQHRDVLVRTGVMSADGFVSMKGLSALMIDAIRQLAAQQRSAA